VRPGGKVVVDDENCRWRLYGAEEFADERGMRDATVRGERTDLADAEVLSIVEAAMDRGSLVAGNLIPFDKRSGKR